jgi:hypothetical protein
MIRLGGIVTLKVLKEAEEDKYVSIGFGKYKEKGKEKDPNSPTFKKDDGGKFIPTKSDKGGKGSEPKKTAPKVNIFDKPNTEPKTKVDSSKPKTNSDDFSSDFDHLDSGTATSNEYGDFLDKYGDKFSQKDAQVFNSLVKNLEQAEQDVVDASMEGDDEMESDATEREDTTKSKLEKLLSKVKPKTQKSGSKNLDNEVGKFEKTFKKLDFGPDIKKAFDDFMQQNISPENQISYDDLKSKLQKEKQFVFKDDYIDAIKNAIAKQQNVSTSDSTKTESIRLTSMLSEISYDPKAKRFLDTIQMVDRSIKDLKNITVDATPRGNWTVYHKGKVLTTINGKLLDDSTIMKYGMEHHG